MTLDSIGFTIKTVSERTGVSVHTLRAWERRYGVPAPKRDTDNRYRLYDDKDIADVMFIKQQVEAGVAPAQASTLLRLRHEKRVSTNAIESVQPIISMQTNLLEAFARSDESTARQLLDEAFALFTPEQVTLSIIEPTMKEIGDRWMRTQMTVWQEHLASNVIQQKLFAVLQSQPALPSSAPLMAAACAPSEEHQLGLVIYALLARRQGWRVAYLGQGTPLEDMVDLARTSKPNAIGVSVTTVVGLAGLIPWLDAANRPNAPLVFGGRMLNSLPSLHAHLPGEYLGADTLSAVQQLATVKMRAAYWSPSRRARQVVNEIQRMRLKLAGETVQTFIDSLPAKQHHAASAANVNFATLFLIDALSCALAFDVPDLMDELQQWLKDTMPARAVMPQMIGKHLNVFEQAVSKLMNQEHARLIVPLLERLKNHTFRAEDVQGRTPVR